MRPSRLGAKHSVAIYPDKPQLAEAAADRFIEAVENAVGERGRCFIALAGGSTPRDLYSRLAARGGELGRGWENVHLLWGDERAVPPESADSNYRMAKEALLDHLPIPAANLHRIRGESDPGKAAAEYSETIQGLANPLRFDLTLLGLGGDGHTASLFAGTPVLDERQEEVAAVFVDELKAWRITLTLPILNRSRQVVFLVAGASKADMVRRIHSLQSPSKAYPASLVQPGSGSLLWMLDEEAAQGILTG